MQNIQDQPIACPAPSHHAKKGNNTSLSVRLPDAGSNHLCPHVHPVTSHRPDLSSSSTGQNSAHVSLTIPKDTDVRQTTAKSWLTGGYSQIASRMLWRNVIDGVKHYSGDPLSGQGINMLRKESFHEFVKDVRAFSDGNSGRPDFSAVSFFLAWIPCLLIQDDADKRAVFKPDLLTQATKDGESTSPLITFQELFGTESNPVMQDPFITQTGKDGKITFTKNEAYHAARKMITDYTLDFPRLATFTKTRMPGVIEHHIDQAHTLSRQGKPMEFTKLFTALAMDVGASLISGFRNVPPSRFYLRSEKNQDLLENVLGKLANPVYFVFKGAMQKASDATKRDLMAYSREMIETNYDVLRDKSENNFIRDMWDKNMGGLDFPDTYADFIRYLNEGTEEQKKGMENLLMGGGFLQLASTETSAQTMNFLLRELHNRPEYQQKIRDEMAANDFQPGEFTLDDMSKYPCLSSLIMETLRLYPPVAVTPWKATHTIKDVSLGERKVDIPKDTWVILDIQRINQTGRWQDDGTLFRPERWQEEAADAERTFNPKQRLAVLASNQSNMHTFSGGKSGQPSPAGHSRVCPGRFMAPVEVALTFAMLLQKYDVKVMDKDGRELDTAPLEHTATSTLRPRNDLYLHLTPRNDA